MRISIIIALCLWFESAHADPKVAILGDSVSTGAGSHPNHIYDTKALWDVFQGDVSTYPSGEDIEKFTSFNHLDSLGAPIYAWPSEREFNSGLEWAFRHFMQFVGQNFLNRGEYSWGYLAARTMGYEARQIIIGADNGSKISDIPRQWDRVLVTNNHKAPEKVFLLFTGNDLCGPTEEQLTTKTDFGKHLETGIRYIERNRGADASQNIEIYVVSFLSVLQLLHTEAILDKPIMAFGEKTSCREIREKHYLPPTNYDPGLPETAYLFQLLMPPNPAGVCPILFGRVRGGESTALIGDLANRIRGYREEQKAIVEKLAEQFAGVKLRYLEQTSEVIFAKEDIANDCFHLSLSGQGRIAEAVLKELQSSN